MHKLEELVPLGFEFGEAFHFKGLGILPILSHQPTSIPPLVPLDIAIENGTATVREVSEGGSVPFLFVENKGENPLLILDGEELIGGKQNRIVNTTIIVLAQASVRIPVSCVEQNRWDYRSQNFSSNKSIFRAASRSAVKESVTENLRRTGAPVSNQGRVWSEVSRTLDEVGTRSATSDFREAREFVSDQIEEFVRAIQPQPDQIGAVFVGERGVFGAELLATSELFSRCSEKIVRSFAFEALNVPPMEKIPLRSSKSWWESILDVPFSVHESIGVGNDIRTKTESLIGSGLIYGGTLIHLSCFPSVDSPPQRRAANRSSISERRRNMLRSIIE